MAVLSIKNKVISRSMLVGNSPYIPSTLLTISANQTNAATSVDGGDTWVLRTMPAAPFWFPLIYANNQFLAIGNASTIAATSPDGITWTQRAMPTASAWSQVAYGNGIYAANGQNDPSVISRSSNGISWTNGTAGSGAYGGIAFGNNIFVIAETTANAGSAVRYSSDAITWTSAGTLGASTGWGRVYYNANGGGFIVISNVSSNRVSQSSTGTSGFTIRTLPSSTNWGGALAYGNGVWSYLAQDGLTAASSTDGITWTSRTATPVSTGWTSMFFSSALGKFIAVGSGSANQVAYSSTGTGSWTIKSIPTYGEWYSISGTA